MDAASELEKEIPKQAEERRDWTGAGKLLLALVAGHVLWVAATSSGRWANLGSWCFQLLAAAAAAAACWQASRRSRDFARIFWRLSAATFAVWFWGDALSTYHDLQPIPTNENQIGTFLVIFLSTAPMFIGSVLSGRTDDETKVRWGLVLDASQILILVLAIHLILVDIPTMNLGEGGTAAIRLKLLHLWRFALAITLVGRAIFDESESIRRLLRPVATSMTVFVLGTWIANNYQTFQTGRALRWFDLAWTVPFAMVAYSATAWRPMLRSTPLKGKAARVQGVVLFYIPSIALPILLLAMHASIQFEQVVVGLGAMMVSILCFSLRLYMMQDQQRRMMNALVASESRYRTLFERNMAGIYTSTLDGRILDCNQAFCEMFGYTRDELLRLPASALYQGGSGKRDAILADLLEHGTKGGVEVAYRHKDGHAICAIENKTVTTDENGQRVLEGAMLDVTQRRSLELQLQHAQKMESMGLLAGGVAHDFNNLLTVMRGYSDFQLEKTEPGDPIHGYAKQIQAAADRAAGLTRQLLAFSRQQVLEARVVNLNSLLRDFETLLRRLIGEDIEMQTVLDPHLGKVKVDPGQMEQVVMNLATNARDAMPDGGTLTLETSNVTLDGVYQEQHPYVIPGPYVRLAISDTGSGMDSGTRARIFEPFFTTKEFGKGTGLGLSTTYGIVKQSQGHIEVYSEVGAGTRFEVYLPMLGPDAKPLPMEKQSAAQRGAETILLVEDDQQLRTLAKTILESYGYTVLAVGDPSEAEALSERHAGTIKLLLTDMILPKMNGREVARRVAARIPAIRVLYMSGFTTHTIVHQGVLEPGVFFLQKPFTAIALARKIREVLDSVGGARV